MSGISRENPARDARRTPADRSPGPRPSGVDNMKKKAIIAAALILAAAVLSSAATATSPAAKPATKPANRPSLPPPDSKTVQAVRTSDPITLDGRLDEAVWKTTPSSTGFTQNDPQDGSPATEPTEVWVAYD